MKKIIYRVDAFADKKYKGNPAGVYLMQEVLSEKEGLPVTTFVTPLSKNNFAIRWFTQTCEVNLCGHGSMAATYWLYKETDHKTIYFQSKSGPLITRITPNEEIVMDFPAQVTTSCEATKKKDIEDVLGIKVKKCLFGYEDYLVELESSEVVVEFNGIVILALIVYQDSSVQELELKKIKYAFLLIVKFFLIGNRKKEKKYYTLGKHLKMAASYSCKV